MNRSIVYWIVAAVLLLGILSWLSYGQPSGNDWLPTYRENGKGPLDIKLLMEYLERTHPDLLERTMQSPAEYFRHEHEEQADTNEAADTVLALLGSYREMSYTDCLGILDFVARGNEAVITSHYAVFYDTLGYSAHNKGRGGKITAYTPAGLMTWPIDSVFVPAHLVFVEDSLWTVLMRMDGTPCVAQRTWGQGKVTICSMPRLLTNAAFVDPELRYASMAMADVVPVKKIIWLSQDESDADNWIGRNPGIAFAYQLAFVTLLVYVLVASRRRQRIIPVMSSLSNSTVEFVWTVGKLYFRQHDNRNLGRKMARLLRDRLHNKLRISPNLADRALAEAIVSHTNVDMATAEQLVADLTRYDVATEVGDDEIIDTFQRHQRFEKGPVSG